MNRQDRPKGPAPDGLTQEVHDFQLVLEIKVAQGLVQ